MEETEELSLNSIIGLLDTFYNKEVMDTGVIFLEKYLSSHNKFENFPLSHVVQSLSKILYSYRYDDEKTLPILHAIYLLLNNFDKTTDFMMQFDIHINLSYAFKMKSNPLVHNEVIRIFNRVSIFNPKLVANTIGIEPFYKIMEQNQDKEELDDFTKECINSIKYIVKTVVYNSFYNHIIGIIKFLKRKEKVIIIDTIIILYYMLKSFPLQNEKYLTLFDNQEACEQIITTLTQSLQNLDTKYSFYLFTCLKNFSFFPDCYKFFISDQIPFKFAFKNQDLYDTFFVLCYALLPPLNDCPLTIKSMNKKTSLTTNDSKTFCKIIKPTVIDIIKYDENGNKRIDFYYIFAVLCQEIDMEIDKEIFKQLQTLINDPNFPLIILKICSMFSDYPFLYKSSLIEKLAKIQVKDNLNWFISHLEPLFHKYKLATATLPSDFNMISNLEELLQIAQTIPTSKLIENHFSKIATDLLNSPNISENEEHQKEIIQNLIDFCCEKVLETFVSEFDINTNLAVLREDPLDFVFQNKKQIFSFFDNGASLAYFSVINNGIDDSSLSSLISGNSNEIIQFIHFKDISSMSYTEKAYLRYFLDKDSILNAPRIYVNETNDHIYNFNDSLFKTVLSLIQEETDEIPRLTVHQNITYRNDENGNVLFKTNDEYDDFLFLRSKIPVTYTINELEVTEFLQLLEEIHNKYPSFNMINPLFDTKIYNSFISVHSLMKPTDQLQFVLKYPYIFSSKTRILAYQILTLDNNVLENYLSHLSNKPHPDQTKQMSIKITVDRTKLWDQVVLLLKTYGRTPVNFDIEFKDEVGVGHSLLNEYFTLISTEFAKQCRNLWFSTSDSSNEFAYSTEKGLILKPDCDLESLKLFGIFCGKAISMQQIVSMPLSQGFFKILLGKELDLSDFGYEYEYFDLKNKESLYGIPFVFPNTNYPLIPEGSSTFTDESNINDYISYIHDMMKPEKWSKIRETFYNAFYNNITPSYEYLLSTEDFSDLLIGSSPRLTKEELQKNLNIGHGFTKDDDEIEWLIDILSSFSSQDTSLFIKYVTGSMRLPAGGLVNLTPPITISCKYNNELPSVLTCTGNFKIRKYSSKEELEKDILTVIHYCCEFSFS